MINRIINELEIGTRWIMCFNVNGINVSIPPFTIIDSILDNNFLTIYGEEGQEIKIDVKSVDEDGFGYDINNGDIYLEEIP